ncbi:MAG: hypothetical protein Q7R30_14075, partial [Acidobacteriota bacterium]|nr:hypothetical protein [Acidobacteriota bacterium]
RPEGLTPAGSHATILGCCEMGGVTKWDQFSRGLRHRPPPRHPDTHSMLDLTAALGRPVDPLRWFRGIVSK